MMALETICVVTLVSALVMIALRIMAHGVLVERGLLDRLGNPRRLFYSDGLHVRLLFLRASEVGGRNKLLFLCYFCAWVAVLVGLLFVGLGVLFPAEPVPGA